MRPITARTFFLALFAACFLLSPQTCQPWKRRREQGRGSDRRMMAWRVGRALIQLTTQNVIQPSAATPMMISTGASSADVPASSSSSGVMMRKAEGLCAAGGEGRGAHP